MTPIIFPVSPPENSLGSRSILLSNPAIVESMTQDDSDRGSALLLLYFSL
ncbi:hypothetical protein J0895_00435 [Phormidium pseudopriestleyi FRX01]|uniref:Uncharacterized protein n=1 Tax=Phormidium pseudopriestleyi FRX01 TaxID=1759528 RepID=A0ABS3FKF2_9CYAN|nr:hypothetical protein [Phormidium pseudopriestleyi]MBO0347599.1 hypothetical protein [Phormidium pseudopriestleyi FRX01]